MMRILAGRFKGRSIKTVSSTSYRPTQSRIRKSLFDILGPLDGFSFLDLYAGSGIIGFEAASRGAIDVTFIEIDNTMKWGFTRQIGIFESWDAIGVERSVEKMKAENRKVPAWVEEMLASGRKSFYETKNGKMTYWCPLKKKALEYKPSKKTFFFICARKPISLFNLIILFF